MDVGTRIREHREAAGLRQDQLAEICGVSRQTISNWERNKTLPDIASLKVMAHELGTTIDALVGDDVPEIKRRVDAEARRFLALYLVTLAFYCLTTFMNVASGFGSEAFDAPLWRYLRAVMLGVALATVIPLWRLTRRHKIVFYGEFGRYLNKNLVLEESRATKIARSMLQHLQIWNGVLITLAALAGFAASSAFSPAAALGIIIVFAIIIAFGVCCDKERQRNGGPVNPPLPPQR